MPRIRTASDAIRQRLARWRDDLLREGRHTATKADVLAQARPSFEAVLVHLSNDDIRSMSDEDLTEFDEWPWDVDGPLSGHFLITAIPGFDPADVFYSDSSATPLLSNSKGGRRGLPWWPRFGSMLAADLFINGRPDVQADLVRRMLLTLQDEGYPDVAESVIKPAISDFYRRTAPYVK